MKLKKIELTTCICGYVTSTELNRHTLRIIGAIRIIKVMIND